MEAAGGRSLDPTATFSRSRSHSHSRSHSRSRSDSTPPPTLPPQVLVVAAEVVTHGLDPEDPHVAPLFGDGAAAVVLTRTPAGAGRAGGSGAPPAG